MSRWYRAYEGTVTDAKLGEVALIAECSRSVAIAAWHAVLENCAALNDGGRFDATARRLAVILGEPVATMTAVMNAFEELGMTQGGSVCAWKERQFESDTSTERSRKFRERQRNGDATLQNVAASAPYTETETETETEKKECARARISIASNLGFPKDGSVEFSPWASVIRQFAPGKDVDYVASAFRKWCHSKGIEFDAPTIDKTLSGFCRSQSKRSANA